MADDFKPGDRVWVTDRGLTELQAIMRSYGHTPQANHHGTVNDILPSGDIEILVRQRGRPRPSPVGALPAGRRAPVPGPRVPGGRVMTAFTVHYKGSGVYGEWRMLTAEGETFSDAAVAAVVRDHQERGLNLAEIPHRVEYVENPEVVGHRYHRGPHVFFYETEPRRVFDPYLMGGWGNTTPGQIWFSCQVREGEPDDCPSCGGLGIDSHNPFRQCWRCGDRDAKVEQRHVSGNRYEPVPETCGSGKLSKAVG